MLSFEKETRKKREKPVQTNKQTHKKKKTCCITTKMAKTKE